MATTSPRLLVIGAQERSLGSAIVEAAHDEWGEGVDVFTAGISGVEKHYCDLTVGVQVKHMLHEIRPDYIVCTVGENSPASVRDGFLSTKMMASYQINVMAPLLLLHHFLEASQHPDTAYRKKFVAISSNSARIARSGSVAYCASKAALSMALRVAARDVAHGEATPCPLIWGYEPGLLAGTPMTKETETAFSGQLHRMRGVPGSGLPVEQLANRIIMDLTYSGPGLHGCLFPYDAGEQ